MSIESTSGYWSKKNPHWDIYLLYYVLKSIIREIGKGKILSCVKLSGKWIITLRNKDDADHLIETGIVRNDSTCNVYSVKVILNLRF